jgi:hypothetical protein
MKSTPDVEVEDPRVRPEEGARRPAGIAPKASRAKVIATRGATVVDEPVGHRDPHVLLEDRLDRVGERLEEPQRPTRFGPSRIWKRARSRRSITVMTAKLESSTRRAARLEEGNEDGEEHQSSPAAALGHPRRHPDAPGVALEGRHGRHRHVLEHPDGECRVRPPTSTSVVSPVRRPRARAYSGER